MKHLLIILISILLLSSFLTSCTQPNGTKYVGEYKDGEYHGQGTYTWSDGDKYEGEYKDGEMWNGTTLRHKRKNLTQDCEWRNPFSLKQPPIISCVIIPPLFLQ